MKLKIVLLLTILISNLSLSQVFFLHGVKISDENRELFEKIETKYMSKVAQDAVDKDLIRGWALLKLEVNEASQRYNYIFVNAFESIEQMNKNFNWWANTEQVLGIESDVLFRNFFEDSGRYYYKQEMEIETKSPSKYVAFYFGHAKDVNAYLNMDKAWMGWHKKNMNTTKLNGWGVGTKIYPTNRNQTTNVMSWHLFKNRDDVMNYVTGQVFMKSTKSFTPFPKVNDTQTLSNGWENIVVGEILSATIPK